MCQMVRCSTPNRTREEDSAEEIEANSDKVDRFSRTENAIPTIGRRPGTLVGILAEGGAILPN